MGQIASILWVESEKATWAADHSLKINDERQTRQVSNIANFKKAQLRLCWMDCAQNGLKYRHYFVTDSTWTIEFLCEEGVEIHQRPLPVPYHIEESFNMTHDVRKRMEAVCGATAYSLTLRNCEHVARYIHSGAWLSYQMLPQGSLGSTFLKSMMDHKQKVNRAPRELQVPVIPRPLYAALEYPGFLRYCESAEGLKAVDDPAFNVVMIGPTGCGKSHLINLLFNQTLAESKASAISVTREMTIYSGEGRINKRQRRVNIIDTIGLCDTHIEADDVLEIIKENIRVNCACIDQVVVICSDRLQRQQIQSIQKILDWLKFAQHEKCFTFVLNKADSMAECARNLELSAMCTLLGILPTYLDHVEFNGDRLRCQKRTSTQMPPGVRWQIPKCFPTGFPPRAPYEAIRNDLAKLVDSMFAIPEGGERILVNESWCAIL